ncbi:MAG: hypothetical protein ABI181_09570 [Mycobacteriaceae bacterium]
MSVADSSLTAVLARARDERRRRLAGSLDAVALTRANTTRSSRALAEQSRQLSAELDPRTPGTTAEVDRGGWGGWDRRPSSSDDAILRPANDPPRPSATSTEAGGDGAPDREDRSWPR